MARELLKGVGAHVALDDAVGRRHDVKRLAFTGTQRTGRGVERQAHRGSRPVTRGLEGLVFRRRWVRQPTILQMPCRVRSGHYRAALRDLQGSKSDSRAYGGGPDDPLTLRVTLVRVTLGSPVMRPSMRPRSAS